MNFSYYPNPDTAASAGHYATASGYYYTPQPLDPGHFFDFHTNQHGASASDMSPSDPLFSPSIGSSPCSSTDTTPLPQSLPPPPLMAVHHHHYQPSSSSLQPPPPPPPPPGNPMIPVDGVLALHKNAQGKYQCQMCEKSYTHGKHLKRHMLRHTGQKPYGCEWCLSRFSRPDIRKRHVLNCKVKKEKQRLQAQTDTHAMGLMMPLKLENA
jgi:uncharacterized Zn-finger protein